MSNQNLYAALIGINAYEKANGLNGCIKDVLNFDRILRSFCSQQKGHLAYKPLYLLAPHPSDKEVIDKYKESENISLDFIAPTFQNVSGKAFDHLGNVRDRDICLLYFSGHGSFIEACPEFWHTKPTHQNETVVCMDSRSTARDLIDKEMAFLLHHALTNKPDVHCLVIMDCCHSGDNTRAINSKSQAVKYRQEPPSSQKLTIEDYIGFKEGFFEVKNGKAYYPEADYIHFAACRDNEKALDSYSGGLFSRKLAELLSNGGSMDSYRNMMQGLSSTVSIQNGQQNPVPYSAKNSNLDKQFLGGNFIPYKPSYEVRYIIGENSWQLQAGSLQGIVASAGDRKTLVNIQPLGMEAEVIEAGDFTATLQGKGLNDLDKENNEFKATITQLAIQRLVIGISEKLKKFPVLVKMLTDGFNSSRHVYIELDSDGKKNADYVANVFEKEDNYFYYLSQAQNDIPVFKSETDADSFLNNVDAVGKWVYVKNLTSKESIFDENDFVFTAEIIEGAGLTKNNIDSLTGKVASIKPGCQIDLSYKNDKQPMLRFSVQIHPNSTLSDCYMQALYLDSLFGIDTDFVKSGTSYLTKDGKVELKTNFAGKYYNILKLKLDKEYAGYNINEITDRIKIVVSAKPDIKLDAYRQQPLKLEDNALNSISRSTDDQLFDSGTALQYAIFNFDVRIIGPKKDKELTDGRETDFSSFSLQVPSGFTATATAVTKGDMSVSARSISNFSPPIWGDVLTEPLPFGDAFGSMTGSSVIALELGVKDGEQMPSLKEGEEIILKPKDNPARMRSLEGYETTTVPYAYDEETQLYFPIGYEDPSGRIHIDQLPKATAGSLVPDAVTTRSVLGSIKLYFKKLLRLPTDTFTLHTCKDGQWKSTTETEEIKKHLQLINPDQKLLLIIHGILGDTKGMLEGMKEDNAFSDRFPDILSYDFENLNTTVPKTAESLKNILKDIGIGENGVPKLTLIAHSMGGLVSRWLIEKKDGDALIEKLIMAGTPNGGSEWSEAAGYILNGAKFLLTHALNVTGPVKYAITGISFLIKKFHDPQASLKDMGLDGQVIEDLGHSSPPDGVPYHLIGSNTGLYREYNGDDPFFTKVKNALMQKIVFPGFNLALFHQLPNDMAVTLNSMKTIPGFDVVHNMTTLPGDHISYFSEVLTRKAILDLAHS